MVVVPQELTDDDAIVGLLQEVLTGWRHSDLLVAEALESPGSDEANSGAKGSSRVSAKPAFAASFASGGRRPDRSVWS